MEHNFSDFCMEEHPQVRAYNNGFESLTVVELISMIIGTGTKRNVEQARQIYNVMGQSLRNITKARPEELQVVQGIGDNKAMALQAAMELAKRFHLEKMDDVIVLSEHYYNGCFLKRNDFMLNHVAALLAYFDGKPTGGTFYTVRNAKRLSLQICNLF